MPKSSNLIPIKKLVNRGGKSYVTTVYVSPQEYKEHLKRNSDSSKKRHINESGHYNPERVRLHKKIITNIVSSCPKPLPGEKPTAILLLGGAASGKSTVVNKFIKPKYGVNFGTLNVDDIKESIPEYKNFIHTDVILAANRVHEESSDIGYVAKDKIINQGRNFIFDAVLGNKEKAKELIDTLKKKGYNIKLVGVNVNAEDALNRAKLRALGNGDGKGGSGRYVPDEILVRGHRGSAETFEEIKDLVDDYELYDNNVELGNDPIKVLDSSEVYREDLYIEFKNKKNIIVEDIIKKQSVLQKAINSLRQLFSKSINPISEDTGQELTDIDISRIRLKTKSDIIADLLQKGQSLQENYNEALTQYNDLTKGNTNEAILKRLNTRIDQIEQSYLQDKYNQVQQLKKAENDLLCCIKDHCQLLRKARSGIYKNTPENRKLGRVGQRYGESGKTDKSGNIIGDGSFHAEYKVFDFKEYPQISSNVSLSDSTESVYVRYSNEESGESVTVRFSNHESNAVKFGDQLDGNFATKDEILYRLGLMKREFIPNKRKFIHTQAVSKKKLHLYEEADKTIKELYNLPAGTDLNKYVGKIAKDSNYLIMGDKVQEIEETKKDLFGNTVKVGTYKYLPKDNITKSFSPELITVTGDFKYKKYLLNTLNRTRDTMPQIDSDNIDDVILHFQGKSPDSKVTKENISLSDLKFAQNEINEDKVLEILENIDPDKLTRFLVSKDNYIIDGNHRICALCEIDEEMEVPCYKIHLDAKEAIRRLNLMKITRNDDITKSEDDDSFEIIQKAFNDDLITPEQYYQAKQQYNIIKARSGVYADTAQNRKLKRVGQKYGSNGQQDQSNAKQGPNNDSKQPKSYSDAELQDYAKNASQQDLERQIKESSDPKIREHAHRELDRRNKEEAINKDKEQEQKQQDNLNERFERIRTVHEDIDRSMGVINIARKKKDYDRFPLLKREDISDEHAATLFNYTGGGYMPVNQGLMKKNPSEEIKEYASMLNEVLDKLDNHEGEVYRSTQSWKDINEIYEEYTNAKKDGNIQIDAFLSTSQDNSIASNNFPGDIKYKVISKTGKDVSGLSDFPGEKEILFKSGTQFKIKKIKAEKGKSGAIKGQILALEIELEEVSEQISKSEQDIIALSGEPYISKSQLIDLFVRNIDENDLQKYSDLLAIDK